MEKPQFDPDVMRDRLVVLIMTFFYTGKFPGIPGTVGSLAGLLLFWALNGHPHIRLGIFLILAICGVGLGARAEKIFGKKDPHPVVIDEVVGIYPAFVMAPPDILAIALGFLIYRIFDITKPFPMRRLERLPAGWGIMADDFLGGIYTALVLRVLFLLNILR